VRCDSHANPRGQLQSLRPLPNIRSPVRAAKKENKSECLYGAEESQFPRQDGKQTEAFA